MLEQSKTGKTNQFFFKSFFVKLKQTKLKVFLSGPKLIHQIYLNDYKLQIFFAPISYSLRPGSYQILTFHTTYQNHHHPSKPPQPNKTNTNHENHHHPPNPPPTNLQECLQNPSQTLMHICSIISITRQFRLYTKGQFVIGIIISLLRMISWNFLCHSVICYLQNTSKRRIKEIFSIFIFAALHCKEVRHIATTQPTTQNNLKQLLLGWYYYR